MKIPRTAAIPGSYSGACFELNKSGPTMLPTALPALHKEMARDFFVCPGPHRRLRPFRYITASVLYRYSTEKLNPGQLALPASGRWEMSGNGPARSSLTWGCPYRLSTF
jgi:hypothetical protein